MSFPWCWEDIASRVLSPVVELIIFNVVNGMGLPFTVPDMVVLYLKSGL